MDFLRELGSYVWSKDEWGYPLMNSDTKDLLKQCTELSPMNESLEIDEIIKKSKAFPIRFPIQANRLEKLKNQRPAERLKRNINSTYPVIHERVLLLMTHFLIFKREFGSPVEKSFYKYMTVENLIDRILKKRAISFMYPEDHYKLITGDTGEEGWEEVGTSDEKHPLLLENCLSYDEMKLSALVYISGYTECINDGSRHNSGLVCDEDIEKEAVIIGLVGPRFERLNRMDYEDIIVTEDQNIPENGYGEQTTPNRFAHVLNKTFKHDVLPPETVDRTMWRQLWSEFYEVDNYSHEQLESSRNIQYKSVDKQYKERFIKLSITPNCEIFDNEVYFKRLSILVECTLLEAEWRAKERGKDAFVNIVGCGLGVWKISLHQTDVFVLTYLERINFFLQKNMLNHISDFNFAYLRPTQGVLDLFNIVPTDEELPRKMFFESKQHPRGGINVQLDNREPASMLTGEHEGKLLVMTYPWDGNAHPGNEFWLGYLTGSGDPAAACCTQVAELHNAHVNPAVSGRNARVVGRHGVERLKDYCAGLS